nr:hypothetical protein [Tanacetum cinerariifolium]
MEYLVKIRKKACILELKRRYFEDYCSDNQYAISIKEDTNSSYLGLRKKSCLSLKIDMPPRDKVDVDFHDLRSKETKFPAIVIEDTFTSQIALSCKFKVSPPVDNEINLRISFVESDDEDYRRKTYKTIENGQKTIENGQNRLKSVKLGRRRWKSVEIGRKRTKTIEIGRKRSKSIEISRKRLKTVEIERKRWKSVEIDRKWTKTMEIGRKRSKAVNNSRIRRNRSKSGENGQNLLKTVEIRRKRAKTMESVEFGFVMKLKVNIVAWNYLVNGMLFNLIKNLDVPFGIPFNPKRYYKDSVCSKNVAEAKLWLFHLEIRGTCTLDTAGALQFQLGAVRRRISWREFILALVLHTAKEMQNAGEFSGYTPSYTLIRDPMLRLCHRLISCSIAGRSQAPEKGAMISGGQFVARLAQHFGLLTEEILQGLNGWVALGPERQPDAAAGAPEISRGAPHRMARLEEDMHNIHKALVEQREVIDAMVRDFSKFTIWAAGGIAHLLDSNGATYTPYSETHVPYQRCVKRRTDGASTSTAQQDEQQPDP